MSRRATFTVLLFCACVAACSTKASYGTFEPTRAAPFGTEPTSPAPFAGEPTQPSGSNSNATGQEVFSPPSGTTLPLATLGQPYTETVFVSGAVPTFVFEGPQVLPPGLTATSNTPVSANSFTSSGSFTISGTPTQLGTFPISIGVGQGTVNYTLTVQP